MRRADFFKGLVFSGASAVATRAVPTTPDEVADRVIQRGAGVPVAVNGPLHLHGDHQTVRNCQFRVDDGAGLTIGGGITISGKE